jgi:hypothetical protein
MSHQQRREINGVRAIFGGEDEYLCEKGIAVVALFNGWAGRQAQLDEHNWLGWSRSYSVTVS